MNTDIRKSIFVTIMSSEDYIDAFERLMRLGLKEVQQREIIRVLIHCCGQVGRAVEVPEKVYNPFYTLIAHKLCAYDYSFRITLQYALWDFMRELGEFDVGGLGRISAKVDEDDLTAGSRKKVPLRRIANLARLYSWLIAKASLSLTVLK
ncbi:suppressor of glycerol defect, partial [Spiromyces aspiralis]